jgi:hypothetical protein
LILASDPFTRPPPARIGCVLINEPVFFREHDWLDDAEGWAPNVVQSKTFDLSDGEGNRIWLQSLGRSTRRASGPSIIADLPIGDGRTSRLGQRSYRASVEAKTGAITEEQQVGTKSSTKSRHHPLMYPLMYPSVLRGQLECESQIRIAAGVRAINTR